MLDETIRELLGSIRTSTQDLFKEIGAISAWRQRAHVHLGRMREELMSVREDLSNLRREVDEQKTVSAGAATAIAGVVQQVKDLQARIDSSGDMTPEEISAELGQMAADLDSSQSELVAAIANVPQQGGGGGGGGTTAAERAANEGNATLEQPNAPKPA